MTPGMAAAAKQAFERRMDTEEAARAAKEKEEGVLKVGGGSMPMMTFPNTPRAKAYMKDVLDGKIEVLLMNEPEGYTPGDPVSIAAPDGPIHGVLLPPGFTPRGPPGAHVQRLVEMIDANDVDGVIKVHACTDGWMHGWMDGWLHGCMDGWMHARMDACMDGWMDG